MFGPFWKKHFALKQFYPIHDNPTAFIMCQWQRDKNKPNIKYLTYRTLVTMLFFTTWVCSMVNNRTTSKWPIFITNWGYTICTLQALLAMIMLFFYTLQPALRNMPNLGQYSLRVYPIYWVMNTIAIPSAFGITVIYWVVIYDAKTMVFDAINYFVHGNNSILMMIDLCMVSHPMRILHFVYPAVFGIIYTIFSVIYFTAGGTNKDGSKCIYKIVDWDKPLPTFLTCFGVIFFLICLHIFVCFVAKARSTLDEKCCSKKQDASIMTEAKRQAMYVNDGMSNDIV